MSKKKYVKVTFFVGTLAWILLWTLGFLNSFVSYLNANPTFPIPLAWLIHQSGYVVSFLAIGFIATREIPKLTRFTLGMNFLIIAFEIAIPPLCIATDGNLLVTAENASCLMGNDSLVSWILNVFGLPYGNSAMFYVTYVLGTAAFAIAGVLMLKNKELWQALVKGMFR